MLEKTNENHFESADLRPEAHPNRHVVNSTLNYYTCKIFSVQINLRVFAMKLFN